MILIFIGEVDMFWLLIVVMLKKKLLGNVMLEN